MVTEGGPSVLDVRSVEVVCGEERPCGFRVHAGYYAQKTRFQPGLCANCKGVIRFVYAGTNKDFPGLQMGPGGHVGPKPVGGGALQQVSIAAATAVLGYDLLRDASFRVANYWRKVMLVGLAGSAAALDTAVRLLARNVEIAFLYNAATGAVLRDHMFSVGERIPPGIELIARVEDAPATNAINFAADIVRIRQPGA